MAIPLITWKCEICGDTRPDSKISTMKFDLGELLNLPIGVSARNLNFCNDRPKCIYGATHFDFRKEFPNLNRKLRIAGEILK